MSQPSRAKHLVRLIHILDLLSNEPFLAVDDICALLGVSRRTIFRDLAVLQEAGIKFYYDPTDGYVLDGDVQLVRRRTRISHSSPLRHRTTA